MIEETRKIRYRLPIRIIKYSNGILNAESLLKSHDDQATFVDPEYITIEKEGYVILDFGEEIAGGIRLITSNDLGSSHCNAHIRFGESVSETSINVGEKGATNDHSVRDLNVILPRFSDQSYGDTGFRFVRIDFSCPAKFTIKNIFAKEWYRDLKTLKEFSCQDQLVNEIFQVAKRTVTLNVQSRIWDGVKRDRLVWIGDMEPEVHALLYLYGNIPAIEQSLFTAEIGYPLPRWLNDMPTYSIWYLLIIYDIYAYSHDKDFLSRHIEYVSGVVKQFNACLDDDGNLDEINKLDIPVSMPYFIDWPTEAEPEEYKKSASIDLLKYTMSKIKEMLLDYGASCEVIDCINSKLSKAKTLLQYRKQLAAFHYLVNKDDESYNVLIKDNAKGMSTFMSYYILTAIADRDLNKAIEIMKEYYGGMLSRGATSFWEDFDVEWLNGSSRIDEFPKEGEKDLHGDYGKYCYVGFRHSLCHGWSCGPVSFLIENEGKIK